MNSQVTVRSRPQLFTPLPFHAVPALRPKQDAIRGLHGCTLLSYVLVHAYCAAGRIGPAAAAARAAAAAAPDDEDALGLAVVVEQYSQRFAEAVQRYEEDAGLAPGAAAAAFGFDAGNGVDDGSDGEEGMLGRDAAGGAAEGLDAGGGLAASSAGTHTMVQWQLAALQVDPLCAAALAGMPWSGARGGGGRGGGVRVRLGRQARAEGTGDGEVQRRRLPPFLRIRHLSKQAY